MSKFDVALASIGYMAFFVAVYWVDVLSGGALSGMWDNVEQFAVDMGR